MCARFLTQVRSIFIICTRALNVTNSAVNSHQSLGGTRSMLAAKLTVATAEPTYRTPGSAITPAEAARRYHKAVHYKTVIRHMTTGCRGIILFSKSNGKGRVTWAEDVAAFLDALDALDKASRVHSSVPAVEQSTRTSGSPLAASGI